MLLARAYDIRRLSEALNRQRRNISDRGDIQVTYGREPSPVSHPPPTPAGAVTTDIGGAMAQEHHQDPAAGFAGSIVLGIASLLVLGPFVLAGAACVVVGLLATLGIQVGPGRNADVPLLVNWLYAGGDGAFRGFVFFMVGTFATVFAGTGIIWCFTGKVPNA